MFYCVFARVFCNHGFSVLFVSYANFDTFAVCKQVEGVGNYSFNFVIGQLNIRKRAITITTPDLEFIYNGKLQTDADVISSPSYANFDTFAVCKQVAADNGGMIKRIAVYRVRDIV